MSKEWVIQREDEAKEVSYHTGDIIFDDDISNAHVYPTIEDADKVRALLFFRLKTPKLYILCK